MQYHLFHTIASEKNVEIACTWKQYLPEGVDLPLTAAYIVEKI